MLSPSPLLSAVRILPPENYLKQQRLLKKVSNYFAESLRLRLSQSHKAGLFIFNTPFDWSIKTGKNLIVIVNSTIIRTANLKFVTLKMKVFFLLTFVTRKKGIKLNVSKTKLYNCKYSVQQRILKKFIKPVMCPTAEGADSNQVNVPNAWHLTISALCRWGNNVPSAHNRITIYN